MTNKSKNKINSKDDISSVSSVEENEETAKVLNPPTRTKMNKGERKARKIISKLPLKPINNVVRVKVRKNQKMTFSIVDADVYKIEGTDSYIIFGDAKMEDIANSLNPELLQKLKASQDNALKRETQAQTEEQTQSPTTNVSTNKSAANVQDKKVIDLDDINATDYQERDVQLVMAQTGCTREEVICSLVKNNNDLVQTIMELNN